MADCCKWLLNIKRTADAYLATEVRNLERVTGNFSCILNLFGHSSNVSRAVLHDTLSIQHSVMTPYNFITSSTLLQTIETKANCQWHSIGTIEIKSSEKVELVNHDIRCKWGVLLFKLVLTWAQLLCLHIVYMTIGYKYTTINVTTQ